MGSSVKKTPSKKGRSAAQTRRSSSKAPKTPKTPKAGNPSVTPSKVGKSPSDGETPKSAGFTHALPTHEQRQSNGRVAGRNLVMWGRPRMTEKLLLHLYYECTRYKVQVPWDAVAHRMHPGSSGAAVIQHINRLRRDLIGEGHLVPPFPQKPSSNTAVDQTIRGYVRKFVDGNDQQTVRPVRFAEQYDDAKFNLPSFEMNSEDPHGFEDSVMADSQDEYEAPDSPSPPERRQRPSKKAKYAETSASSPISAAASPAPERNDDNENSGPFNTPPAYPASGSYYPRHEHMPPNASFPPGTRPRSQPHPGYHPAQDLPSSYYRGFQQDHPNDRAGFPRMTPNNPFPHGAFVPYPVPYPVHPSAWQPRHDHDNAYEGYEHDREDPFSTPAKSPSHSKNGTSKAETISSSEADRIEGLGNELKNESPTTSDGIPDLTVSVSEDAPMEETDVLESRDFAFGDVSDFVVDGLEEFLGGGLEQEFVVDQDLEDFMVRFQQDKEEALLLEWTNAPDFQM